MTEQREPGQHELHDAAEPGSRQTWHIWVWGAVIIAGMIGLLVAIMAY